MCLIILRIEVNRETKPMTHQIIEQMIRIEVVEVEEMITIAEMIIVVMIIMAEEMMVTTATIAVEVVIVTITEAMVGIEVEVEEIREIVIIADRDMEIMVVQTEIGNEVEADHTNIHSFLDIVISFSLIFFCHEENSLTKNFQIFLFLN